MTKEQYKQKRITELGINYKKHSTSKRDWDMCISMECGDLPIFQPNTSAEFTLRLLLECKYTEPEIINKLNNAFPGSNNESRPRRVINSFSGHKCRNVVEFNANGALGLTWDRYKFFSPSGIWKDSQKNWDKQLSARKTNGVGQRGESKKINVDKSVHPTTVRSRKNFVINENEVANSVIAFFNSPEYWREAVSSHPKYFVHLKENGVHKFGLSKFCAFNDISLADYIEKYRYTTDGGKTQKHIANVTEKQWLPFTKSTTNLQNAFENWFYSFYPSKYDLNNIFFLSLQEIHKKSIIPKTNIRNQSPESLRASLQFKEKIGKVGQEIAYRYELKRILDLGIKDPEKFVDKTYNRNVSAGFDIWSQESRNKTRYIEVKSTTKEDSEFFITSHEIDVLKKHNKSAYIYFVLIDDIKKETGKVSELQNPIGYFDKSKLLKPILFRGKILTSK